MLYFSFLFVPRIFFLNGKGRFSRRPPLTHSLTRSVRVSAFTFSPSVLLLSRQDAAAGGNGCYLEVLFVPEPSNEGKERTDYHQPEKCLPGKSFSLFGFEQHMSCSFLLCYKNSEKEIPTAGERRTIRLSARGATGG